MKSIVQMIKRRKGTIFVLLLVIVGAVIGASFWNNKTTANDYITAQAERGDLRMIVNATGAVQAITTVQVGSQVSGTIEWLGVDFNSKVKQGDIIARLDPSTFQSQVDNAQAAVQSAEAAQETAQKALGEVVANVEGARANKEVTRVQRDDARRLVTRNKELASVISARDIESAVANAEAANARYLQASAQVEQAHAAVASAKAKLDQSAAQVKQAQSSLEQAKITLSRSVITSPIDGIVVSRDVNVGQTVAASLQAPTLFTIANNLTKMQVLASIDEADMGRIREGQTATFTVDAFPGESFNGTISQVRLNPINTQNVVTYSAVIQFENPAEKLRPGMTANVTVPVEERENALLVPNAALRFKPQGVTRNVNRTNSGEQRSERGPSNRGSDENRTSNDGRSRENREQVSRDNDAAKPAPTPGAPGANSGSAGNRTAKQTIWILKDNNELEPRRIEVGISDGKMTEVKGGELKEGERILIGQIDGDAGNARPQTGSPFGGNRPSTGGSRRRGF